MNSEPIRCSGYHVADRTTTATATVSHRTRIAARIMGRYRNTSRRLSGFLRSGNMRPRTRYPASTGTQVMASRAAAAIVYVLVKASGLKSRPSWACRAKMGAKDRVMISRE